jgi:hypothetical protein
MKLIKAKPLKTKKAKFVNDEQLKQSIQFGSSPFVRD